MGKKHDEVLGETFSGEHCVCDVLRAIADAQDDVFDNTCDISCARSINNLLSPVGRSSLDTVPVILYGKDLKPFKGFGVDVELHNGEPKFECTESFIFRVTEVSDDDDCCAVLELLDFDDNGSEHHHKKDSPCKQLDHESVEDLSRTGICITVDLKCFCAVTCLPAVSIF
ncbi:CotY/CotZ family spore coat protein [Sediminibacillus massiliensis]|uniref:CotY/CotZ family spore coat protein n=1 Tax=Sediminibacillus massiliensis TaxID=1926277 RepID=UPI00098835C6|nr:CotY/CotZ family spore coat protein [Sediminibacillus massiliensis]